jgi:hypothetical protein
LGFQSLQIILGGHALANPNARTDRLIDGQFRLINPITNKEIALGTNNPACRRA